MADCYVDIWQCDATVVIRQLAAAVSLLGLGLTYAFVEDKRGARMEGEEERSSAFGAHEGEGEPPQPPPAQYGARGAVAVVGLH